MWIKETMESLIDLVENGYLVATDTYKAAAISAFKKQIPNGMNKNRIKTASVRGFEEHRRKAR